MTTQSPNDAIGVTSRVASSPDDPAPSPATQYASLFVDDMPDPPLSIGDFCPGYFLVDGEVCLLGPDELLSLFTWAPLDDSTPAPLAAPPSHFLDDLPDTTSSSDAGVDSPLSLFPTPIDPSSTAVAIVAHVKPPRGSLVTADLFPLFNIIQNIRESDRLRLETEKGRALAVEHGRKSDEYKTLKLSLPGFLPSSSAPVGTAVKGLPLEHHTGLYCFDLDEFRPVPIEDMREELRATPGVVAFGTSLGGDGMWAILAGPVAATETEHKANWIAMARSLPPRAAYNNGPESKNSNRIRALSFDPDVWLTDEPVQALAGGTPEDLLKATRNAEKSAKKRTADPSNLTPLTEREITLLGELAIPEDYNHWLSWITTLKAVGFTAEQVEQWSSAGKKYQHGEVAEKWETLPTDPPPEARARFRKAVGGGLLPLVEACYSNMTDTANFHRLVHHNAERLVIALPGPDDGPDVLPDIYGIDSRGILSRAEFEAAVLRSGRCYLTSSYGITDKGEFLQVAAHARKMRDAGAPERLRRVAAGALSEQREFGAQPDELVVKSREDIDSDLSVIGTPSGVLDLKSGKILAPAEARKHFVVANTDVDYYPTAQHDKVDEILPPPQDLKGDSPELYRAQVIGHGMLHAPAREMLWEICDRASGKSSFFNCLQQGLGMAYIKTVRREALQLPKYNNGASSHNGDLRAFKPPARFVFAAEMRAGLDGDLIKSISGGDRLSMRRIHRENESFAPSAHLWVQGNPKAGRDTPSLGIEEDSEDSAAILDRARMLERPMIPVDVQDPSVVLLNTPEFKTAALARIVQYTKIYGSAGFPDTIPSFRHLVDQQRRREIPSWKSEWLPNCLIPLEPGDTAPEADNRQIYEDLTAWHEEFGEGRLPAKNLVGSAVRDFYKIDPERTKVRDETDLFASKWVKAFCYRGFKVNAPQMPRVGLM